MSKELFNIKEHSHIGDVKWLRLDFNGLIQVRDCLYDNFKEVIDDNWGLLQDTMVHNAKETENVYKNICFSIADTIDAFLSAVINFPEKGKFEPEERVEGCLGLVEKNIARTAFNSIEKQLKDGLGQYQKTCKHNAYMRSWKSDGRTGLPTWGEIEQFFNGTQFKDDFLEYKTQLFEAYNEAKIKNTQISNWKNYILTTLKYIKGNG